MIDKEHRKTIAEQAQAILEGKAQWSPTWKSLPDKAKVMKGIVEGPKGTKALLTPPSKKALRKAKEAARKGRTIRVL